MARTEAALPDPIMDATYRDALQALRLGQAGTAERLLRAILARAPGEPGSLSLLGAALLTQGKAAEALEALEAAVAAAPGFAPARVDLARAYRRCGRTEAAREMLKNLVREAPQLERAWLAYGDVLFELGRYDDAKF